MSASHTDIHQKSSSLPAMPVGVAIYHFYTVHQLRMIATLLNGCHMNILHNSNLTVHKVLLEHSHVQSFVQTFSQTFSHLQTIYDCFHSSTVQSWVVPKYTLWPAKSKMFTSYLLTENFANLCLQGVIPLLSYHFSHCYSASAMLTACSFMLFLLQRYFTYCFLFACGYFPGQSMTSSFI